jgi:SAM-dependent methyltransferase
MTSYTVQFGKPAKPTDPDGRLDAPAFHRNHEPIWSVLSGVLLGRSGDVLELGSGTGQHVVTYAARTPDAIWWPSDVNAEHLRSIAAWRDHAQLANVRPPHRIDLSEPWQGHGLQGQDLPDRFIAMLCINVLHIAPWSVAEGLIAVAGRLLEPEGRLFVYGPFMRGGRHTADSNAAFDLSLRRENRDWGVRDTDDLDQLAQQHGLRLAEAAPMPANNFVLVFARI